MSICVFYNSLHIICEKSFFTIFCAADILICKKWQRIKIFVFSTVVVVRPSQAASQSRNPFKCPDVHKFRDILISEPCPPDCIITERREVISSPVTAVSASTENTLEAEVTPVACTTTESSWTNITRVISVRLV